MNPCFQKTILKSTGKTEEFVQVFEAFYWLKKNVVSLFLTSLFLKGNFQIFPNYIFQAAIKKYFLISFPHLWNVEKIFQSLLKNVDLEKYTSFPYTLGSRFCTATFCAGFTLGCVCLPPWASREAHIKTAPESSSNFYFHNFVFSIHSRVYFLY